MSRFLAAAAFALSLAATAQAAPVPERAAQQPTPTVKDTAGGSWLDSLSAATLFSVDGSTLQFKLDEDGMTRHIVSADGTTQDTAFVYVNASLGTVHDGAADNDITGFFRRTPNGLEITFADGRFETITALPDGGVAMTQRGDGSEFTCVGWHPRGHAFSEPERQAALAAYAKRLGLAAQARKPLDSCNLPAAAPEGPASVKPAPVAEQPAAKPSPPVAVQPAAKPAAKSASSKPARRIAKLDPPSGGGLLAPLVPVAVRTSEIHAVDDAPPSTKLLPGIDPSEGASNCLKVDSDGGHWGFRNACEFDVRYAYCLKNAGAEAASCDAGAETGLVTANGFAPLITASVLGGNGAEQKFRWIACGMTKGAVEARLEQTNPPAGRCIRPQPKG
jgi:hypothetical protein